jgi:Ni/Co efflux regulator RcnB
MKKMMIAVVMVSAMAFAPASAAMMACTGDNMAKTLTTADALPDGPVKMGVEKEMGMANTDVSQGKMRSACMHYMKAQKMSTMKQGM